jgi:hypothetical protein
MLVQLSWGAAAVTIGVSDSRGGSRPVRMGSRSCGRIGEICVWQPTRWPWNATIGQPRKALRSASGGRRCTGTRKRLGWERPGRADSASTTGIITGTSRGMPLIALGSAAIDRDSNGRTDRDMREALNAPLLVRTSKLD